MTKMYHNRLLNFHYTNRCHNIEIIWGVIRYRDMHMVILTSQQQIIGLGLSTSINSTDNVCHDLADRFRITQIGRDDSYVKHYFDPHKDNLTSNLPLNINLYGTPFQHRVWQALNQVSWGEITTYQQLASQIGQPNAYRAVGNAIGRNPVAFLIPCHRVKLASGHIGGFHWGTDIKQQLLAWEQNARL